MDKIAILVDSGSDVPENYIEKYGIYVVPLLIEYEEGTFRDRIDISAQEVYDRMETEVPKTSLPSMETVANSLETILADGYQKIIAITISSGLSGTHQALQIAARDLKEGEMFVLDTKNIGIGAGFAAIMAGEAIAAGKDFDTIVSQLQASVEQTKVFFCVDTLEYLKKGGRIGAVSYVLGSALQLRPIISCNKEGTYYTARMARGKLAPWHKALELAKKFIEEHRGPYNIAVVSAIAGKAVQEVCQAVKEAFPHAKEIIEGQVSPALGVHTGPGLLGIGVQRLFA